MSVPYPIVKLTDPAARTRLIKDLMDMGIERSGVKSFDQLAPSQYPSLDYTHISIMKTGRGHPYEIIGRVPSHIGLLNLTLVNSPAHMLAYIRRMGIKP